MRSDRRAELTSDRAVLLRYQRDRPRHGSGFRIGGTLILTADHCAKGTDHRVIVDEQEWPAVVLVRSGDGDVHVAVLDVPGMPPLRQVSCALVDRNQSAHLQDCQAMGFPVWKGREVPLLAQARGDVPHCRRTQSGWRGGGVVVIEDNRPGSPDLSGPRRGIGD